MSNCSEYVKFCNSSGISPTQRPFARAKVGIFFLSRDSTHMEQTLLQPGASMGPLNSLTGSVQIGISPTQRPFARAKVGIFFLSRDSTHMEQTLLQPGASMGPLNSLTGSA